MLFHTNRKLNECHLIILYLLLTQCLRGKSQLINSPQTIIATLGHDIILPCNLVPGEDASDLTLEWTRPDLNPRFVHVCRSGEELVDITHELFKKRTSLFTDELKLGNISLKLSKVKIHDQGTYRCFIPKKDRQSFVQLVVGSDAVTSPVITLADTDKANRLVLQCESKGWYPEPEVSWLDSEGNLLSAGPTETVRGPDDLYTVSRRLTVEKSDNFTCRVQQKNINQTRETHFYVPDDFFELQSSSSAVTVGLAVSLAVCITFIFSVIFLFWKWRQKIIKIKTSRRDETDGDKEEAQPLRTRENVEVNKQLETELQQLCGEKQRNENELQTLKKEVDSKNKELTEEKQKHEKELEDKRTEVKKLTEEKQTLNKELEDLRTELETQLQQLREEKERNENELQTLKEKLEKNKELQDIKTNFST
ncbi:CD276 antigen-like isoform X2 [Larimichthys crocea]|uniref:CD276 antigen-like isoform X2 n=1 Tax=Larimichthys crocea TaxID=215358 RepID=UPI000F5D6A2A|nr:CD276 antigen-like isoform X2 [Larimichthys crocea]